MKRLFAIALALVAIFATHAHAQWMPTGAPVATLAASQQYPAVAPDGAGGCYLAWTDYRTAAGDLYAQHLLADGRRDPAWPVDGVAVSAQADVQSRPCLISDGAGGAYVSWVDRRNGTSWQPYLHRLRPAGLDPAWPAAGRLLSNAFPALDKEVQLAPDGAGGVYALCPQQHASTDYRVQRVSAGGVLDPNFGTGVLAGTANFTGGRYESIAADGAGGAFVAFGGQNFGVFVHRVLATGVVDPAWPVGGRALTPTSSGSFPNVVSDGAGGAIVVWNHVVNGDLDIRAQRVTSAGAIAASWPDTGLAVTSAPNSQQTPFLAPDGAGGAFVAWSDVRAGSQFDVYAHHVLGGGTMDSRWTANGKQLTTTIASDVARQVFADGAGGAIVLWESAGSGDNGLFAQRLDANGAVHAGWPSPSVWITGLFRGVTSYGYASDPATHDVFVGWDEFRLGTTHARERDIYARRLPASGTHRITTTQSGTSGGYVLVPDSLSIYWTPFDYLSKLDMTTFDRIEFRFPSYAGQSVTDVTANGVSLGPAPNHVFRDVTQDIALNATWTSSLVTLSTDLAAGAYASLAWPMTYTKDSVSTLLDEVWPTDDRKWRFAHWDPAAGAYSYSTDTLTRIRPGVGYWLGSRAARTVAVPGRPVWQASTSVALAGDAASGWNQIANPYRFPIADTALRVVSGATTAGMIEPANTFVDSTVWEWTGGSSYAPVHTLQPYKAYWVRKRTGSAVAIVFPGLTSTRTVAPPPARPADAEWAVAITASQGDARTSPVTLGAWQGAVASAPLRRESPPDSPEGGLRLSVGEAAATRVREQDAFVGASAPRAWTLELAGAEAPGEVVLELQALDLPSGITLELRDPALGWSRTVRPGERVTVAATPLTRRLTLEAFEGSLPSTGSTGPRVLAAWPNPFHGSLGFAAQLAAGGDVRVSIHDVQGRVVRVLERRALPVGESVLVWDGRGADGAPARPGVYLARWSVGAHAGTSRIVKLD